VLSKIKIRNQMFAMIATVFVPFAVALAVAVLGISSTVDRFSQFVDEDQVELLAYTEMYAQGLQMGQALRNIQLDPQNPIAFENLKKAGAAFGTAFEGARTLVNPNSNDADHVSKIGKLREEQQKLHARIVETVKANDANGARALTNTQETPLWREMKQIMLDKIAKSRTHATETKQQVVQASKTALIETMALAALAVVVGLIFSISIATAVTRRINQAVAVSAQIAAGDLHQPIQPEGNNEVGQLMASLKVMQLKLKNIVRAIQENSTTLNKQVVSFEAAAASYAVNKDESTLTELLDIIKKLTRTADFFDRSVTRFKA
jgi:methyl-accepting chemotaxis protein